CIEGRDRRQLAVRRTGLVDQRRGRRVVAKAILTFGLEQVLFGKGEVHELTIALRAVAVRVPRVEAREIVLRTTPWNRCGRIRVARAIDNVALADRRRRGALRDRKVSLLISARETLRQTVIRRHHVEVWT